ncbi:GYDIA family GHMP kinase [Marinilabilia sp.]
MEGLLNNDGKSYYAHGKLLLSGEYLVLKGALALAIPLIKGQHMSISNHSGSNLKWTAFTPDREWFSAEFNEELSITFTNDSEKAKALRNILFKAAKLKNLPTNFFSGKRITTKLEFDPNWGWGSSSTLISNLAKWLNINPYHLLNQTFGGSGYDLACANAKGPIFYSLPENIPNYQSTSFTPPFEDQLWVGYLNRKQSSSKAIKEHLNNVSEESELIKEISQISKEMSSEQKFENFAKLMIEHESLIGGLIGWLPLKEKYFKDFPGAIKSLGAWGGDFFMALSPMSDDETKKYFQTKGMNILFKIKDIKLNS